MNPEEAEHTAGQVSEEGDGTGATEDLDKVSGRFLSDFFHALEREGLPARELLGDLPVAIGERGEVTEPVEWDHFVEFMRRLARSLGGASEVERCGETIGDLKPARLLAGLAGLTASPHVLYRAASGWVLRRALPGVQTRLRRTDEGQLEIHAWIADGLRACPELFHFAAGGARALPRVIGLRDAVVVAEIAEREARYRITVPPSPTLFARLGRVAKAIASAGDVLRFLEAQQLELHAKNAALQRANDALAESEQRYRAIAETAFDVLAEIDRDGRVVYVSASVERLIGYSPEQVTGSHFRLWIPREWHDRSDEVFHALLALPPGRATQEIVRLHASGGDRTFAELTARTYDTRDGDRRIVVIARDLTDRAPIGGTRNAEDSATPQEAGGVVSAGGAAPASLAKVVERALGEDPSFVVETDTDGSADPDWIEKDEDSPEPDA